MTFSFPAPVLRMGLVWEQVFLARRVEARQEVLEVFQRVMGLVVLPPEGSEASRKG